MADVTGNRMPAGSLTRFWWLLGVVALLAVVAAAWRFGLTGLEGKTLWDVMELLIVPLALAVVAVWFDRSEKAQERRLAAEEREQERRLAEEAQREEREISADNQRESTLHSYLDHITGLLLDRGLKTSPEEAEVRIVARAWTLNVLLGMDGVRKARIVKFLYEAGLLSGETPVVSLDGADLSDLDREVTDFEGINLRGAVLTDAKLPEGFSAPGVGDRTTAHPRKPLP